MKLKRSRVIAFNVLIAVLLLIIVAAYIYNTQISTENEGTIGAYTQTVDAARGEILDRNGQPLVTNRQGNSIIFNAAEFPSSDEQAQRNEIILSLIEVCNQNSVEYVDNLPIKYEDGEYSFTDEDGDETYITWLESSDVLNLNSYATADNVMDALIEMYDLQGYGKSEARDIASVLIDMKKTGFNTAYPYTFAEDVPTELVTIVKENSTFYQGVESEVVSYRQYTDGTLAPHILGRVSSITAEKYEEEQEELEEAISNSTNSDEIADLERNAYTYSDEYGSSGIESAFEEYLRGTRGEKTVTIADDGTTEEVYTVQPEQGNTVILTIDSGLQKVAQESLENRVETLNISSARECAGAVIVENVNTGEILACATYPTYDNDQWDEMYSEWASDDNAPLWNRALNSTYEPGSTFKPCTAIAALENGIIDASWTYTCTGYYTYYSDMTFDCAHNTAHGTNTVVDAIDKSCNCFFYEAGRLLGIDEIDKWATNFGLGQKTGIELSEATGQVSSPSEREASGGTWYAGDTITTAIGESDNQFTLIQLANYVSTIANGGTRYVPHFVKEIKTADYTDTILKKEATVAQVLDIDEDNLELVKQGMLKVGTTGFCESYFKDLPVQVAAKTGTSDVVKIVDGNQVEGNNGFLISFAPYEDPEIAVAVVIETADSGSLTAVVAADIYEYYFSAKTLQSTQSYETLLS